MLFRKYDGSIVEVKRSDFTTDKAYYQYILKLV